MIRPWQPAFPQAMQRHGGQTRPAVAPAAKAADARRDPAPGDDRAHADGEKPTTEAKE